MSKMSIGQFRSMFKNGFARAARYSVNWMGTTLYPESVTLPSKSLTVFTHSLFGPIMQYPYRETFNDNIVLTFPEDALGRMRNFWESNMNTAAGGAAFPQSIDTQVSNMQISQLSLNDIAVSTYDIYGAYPINIVPVNMGYGMQNETTKVQVMIKYYRYEYHQTGSAGGTIAPTTPTQPGQIAQGLGFA